jgi:hypothetical protein
MAVVYALRRFMDDGLHVTAVYKLPPEFMTSGDENTKARWGFAVRAKGND